MANAFDRLGIEPGLVLTEETLREAFRAAGKQVHPDAGGGEGEFTALNEAFAILSSPSRRLRHWLECRGLTVETRGTIDTELMDLFADVGAVTQRAEALIRKRDEAKSTLVRAMLGNETQSCREELEVAIAKVEHWIARECEIFPSLETSEHPDLETAFKTARNLVFLEKWRAGLRAGFSRLI
ncbi:MAG: DnaJ domain-containing protein [Akkermansiaceae bacterium]